MSGTIADLPSMKHSALSFLTHVFKCQTDEALAMLAPDATWWVLGDPKKIRVAGTRDVVRIERLLRGVRGSFPEGMDVQFEGVTAEGERVAVEVIGKGHTMDGTVYRNRYHFLLKMRDRYVFEVREYLDTQYVYEFEQTASTPR